MDEIQILKQLRNKLHQLRKKNMRTTDINLRDGILEITNEISQKIGYLEAKNKYEKEEK